LISLCVEEDEHPLLSLSGDIEILSLSGIDDRYDLISRQKNAIYPRRLITIKPIRSRTSKPLHHLLDANDIQRSTLADMPKSLGLGHNYLAKPNTRQVCSLQL